MMPEARYLSPCLVTPAEAQQQHPEFDDSPRCRHACARCDARSRLREDVVKKRGKHSRRANSAAQQWRKRVDADVAAEQQAALAGDGA